MGTEQEIIRTRVGASMRARLEALATERRETISVIVREAIVFYLSARGTIGLPDESPLPSLDQVVKLISNPKPVRNSTERQK